MPWRYLCMYDSIKTFGIELVRILVIGTIVIVLFGISGLALGYYTDTNEFAKQMWPNIAASIYIIFAVEGKK